MNNDRAVTLTRVFSSGIVIYWRKSGAHIGEYQRLGDDPLPATWCLNRPSILIQEHEP